jgi:hypothetical protein
MGELAFLEKRDVDDLGAVVAPSRRVLVGLNAEVRVVSITL